MPRHVINAAVLFLASVATVSAATLVEETFDYTPGNLNGANGGVGWNGGWIAEETSTDVEAAGSFDFSYPGLVKAGNHVVTDARGQGGDASRSFASLIPDDGSTVWMGIQFQGDQAKNTNHFQLISGTNVNLITLDGGNSVVPPAYSLLGGADFQASTNAKQLFLVEILFSGDGNDETVNLYQNPNLADNPLNWVATATGTAGLDAGILGVSWEANDVASGAIRRVRFDEIRFATTPQEAAGLVIPEPASIAIWSLLGLGICGFGCHRLRRKK